MPPVRSSTQPSDVAAGLLGDVGGAGAVSPPFAPLVRSPGLAPGGSADLASEASARLAPYGGGGTEGRGG